MPYRIGAKGSYGCSGFPALKEGTNEVMGCHTSRAAAAAQIYAINRSEGNIDKAMPNLKEGDFAMTAHGGDEEFHVGQVVHVMREGMLGVPGGEYTLEATADNPAVMIQLFEQDEEGFWEATRTYTACMMSLYIPIDPLPMEPEMSVEDMPNMNAQPDLMDAYDNSIGKAKKPNYGEMIEPRRGGSEPANTRLYATILREAKDKFDVYPSAVANAWVVQEYKRRGGTYKAEKRERSMATRERLAETGAAMEDGSYPIVTEQDLRNAIQAVGRAKNYEAAKQHIIRRARALGMTEMLPEDWKNSAQKGMTGWGGSVFDLNPFVK